MILIDKYSKTVKEATEIAIKSLNSENYEATVKERSKALVKTLENGEFVKIPFVGDFNAGKSSLINAFVGRDLLPTNIRPETAVAYEMYYSQEEKLEQYRDDKLLRSFPIDKIKEIDTQAGDLVKVFINSDKIKNLNERNIVIVDMPGIDSGLEAHNAAINKYILNGKGFVLVSDIEQGTLRTSTISFIEELKKFGIAFTLLLSKTDKKPKDEVANISEYISKQINDLISQQVYVGLTSAHSEDFGDLETALTKFNAEQIVEAAYKEDVRVFIQNIMSEIYAKIQFVKQDHSELDAKVQEIKEGYEVAIKELKENRELVSDTDEATDRILEDVKQALIEKASFIANIMVNNKDNQNVISDCIMSVIRPAIYDSLKDEAGVYQEKVSSISIDFGGILSNPEDAKEGGIIGKIKETLIPLTMLDSKVISTLGKLGKLGKILTRFIPYIGQILLLLDLVNVFKSDDSSNMVEKIKNKFVNNLISQILTSLRGGVSEMIEETRNATLDAIEEAITTKSQEYQQMIEDTKKEDNIKKEGAVEILNSRQKDLEKLQEMIA